MWLSILDDEERLPERQRGPRNRLQLGTSRRPRVGPHGIHMEKTWPTWPTCLVLPPFEIEFAPL